MTDKRKYFNVDEFHNWKKTHGENFMIPPLANFLAATNYIRDLFTKNKFAWGIMGGMQMLCLGYRREMPDLHIAYDDRDFAHLKARLMADRRFRLPDGMNSLLPTKVLVQTGPDYKDAGCTQTAFVEVDLVPPGVYGTPPTDSLSSNLVLLSLITDENHMTFKGLNMLYLVKTMLHYCRVRGLAWDPRKDIVFLCQKYGEDIQQIRSQLNQKEVQEHFLGTPFFSRLPPDEQRRCYLILLDKEPPPMMAITPPTAQPGHKYSASASDPVRPYISSHKSSLSVNTHASSEHLSLPLLGHSHHHAPKNGHQPHAPSTPQSHAQLDQHTTSRDSRSRYRNSSAPGSRNPTPNSSQPTIHSSRPKSMDLRLSHQQSAVPSPQARITNMQSVLSSKPQAVSSFCPVPMIAEARKSMPNLHALSKGPIQPYAFTQTPLVNESTVSQQHLSMRPVSMLGAPGPRNPGQHHLKSQLGLAHDTGFGQMGPPVPITVNPKRPQARASSHRPQLDKTALSETHIPGLSEPKIGELHLVGPEGLDASSTKSSDESSEPQVSKFHISGVEGLYAAPYEKSPNVHSEHESSLYPQPLFAPKNSSPLFELDATTQQNSFVTEQLVDEIKATTVTSSLPIRSHRLSESSIFPHTDSIPALDDAKINSQPTRKDSPVSPPDATSSTATLPAEERPPCPRTQSAPLAALPVSLMAGGAHPQHRSPRTSMSHSPPQTASPPENTNASKYVRYYAEPTQNKRQSAYKAYNLASTPLARPEMTHAHTEPTHPHQKALDSRQDEDELALSDHNASQGIQHTDDDTGEYYKVQPEHAHEEPSHEGLAGQKTPGEEYRRHKSHDSKELAEEYRLELSGLEKLYRKDTGATIKGDE